MKLFVYNTWHSRWYPQPGSLRLGVYTGTPASERLPTTLGPCSYFREYTPGIHQVIHKPGTRHDRSYSLAIRILDRSTSSGVQP